MGEIVNIGKGDVAKELEAVGDFMVDYLVNNIIDQGHKGSGKLIASVANRVKVFTDGLGVQVEMNRYGAILNKGVAADRIPFTIGSGAKTSKYISGLIRFARRLPFVTSLKQAKSMAFAIAIKHKKEGMPTNKSRRFSKTGRRTGFIEDTREWVENEIAEEVQKGMVEVIDKAIVRLVNSV